MIFMKQLILLNAFIMLLTFSANAQTSKLEFETKVHNFGLIQEDDGMVTIDFEFTNDGDAPLMIYKVTASCGCTTPEWTQEPIPVNEKGFIRVSYNPKGRPGVFSKTVTVKSSSSDQPIILQIKGEVIR